MIFQKKDMDTWDRAEIFCHFIDELRCVMSMTVEPVSYTHPDVYKRQAVPCAPPMA